MSDPAVAAPPSASTLAEALAAAFAGEVAQRLPRMLDAAERLRAAGVSDAAVTLRGDAHTLASSAIIVNRPAVAELARRCELLLNPYCEPGIDRVPTEVADAAAHCVEAMQAELSVGN